uniref:Uncharacterized protein n=1 Tax=Parascaris equorum TaxID=6256 RepID=A0A914S565_PAREQ
MMLHTLSEQVSSEADKMILSKYKTAVEKRLRILEKQGLVQAISTTTGARISLRGEFIVMLSVSAHLKQELFHSSLQTYFFSYSGRISTTTKSTFYAVVIDVSSIETASILRACKWQPYRYSLIVSIVFSVILIAA